MTGFAKRTMQAAAIAAVFGAGFLSGSATERSAQAQIDTKALGGAVVKEAANQQGGGAAAAAQLGTTITDMQTHLDGLNKNIGALRQIQGALGG